ncbi:MAG: Cullin family protein [Amphiamblys sp. WSBS2006]|nr:MAG: Cullin family protein [Amphiamblys sp. WSBS2006]
MRERIRRLLKEESVFFEQRVCMEIGILAVQEKRADELVGLIQTVLNEEVRDCFDVGVSSSDFLGSFVGCISALERKVSVLSQTFSALCPDGKLMQRLFKRSLCGELFSNTERGPVFREAVSCLIAETRRGKETVLERVGCFLREHGKKVLKAITKKEFCDEKRRSFWPCASSDIVCFFDSIRKGIKREMAVVRRLVRKSKIKKNKKKIVGCLFGSNTDVLLSQIDAFMCRKRKLSSLFKFAKQSNEQAKLRNAICAYLGTGIRRSLFSPSPVEKLLEFESSFAETTKGLGLKNCGDLYKGTLEGELGKEKLVFSEKLVQYWERSPKEEESIESVMRLFRCIRGKIVFRGKYTEYLKKKISLGTAGRGEIEKEERFLRQLMIEGGEQYVEECSAMIGDVCESSSLLAQYREKEGDTVFSPVVLSSAMWESSLCSLRFPFLSAHAKSFESFYAERHPRRRLCWDFQKGSVSIDVYYGGRTVEFVMQPFQASVFLLFGECDEWGVDDLVLRTGLDREKLGLFLSFLLGEKVIEEKNKKVRFNREFSFSPGVFHVPFSTERKGERSEGLASKTSAHLVEAFVVKKAKQQKTVEQADAFRGVAESFGWSAGEAESVVEGLVQKGYLSREGTFLRYVP